MPNSDPLADVRRGQPLEITAATWNAMMAAAKAFRQPGRPDAADAGGAGLGVVEVLAVNSTGADLAEFKPVTITAAGGYDLTDAAAVAAWRDRPTLTLGVPSASSFVGVTREAIPNGQTGLVAVAGVVACEVHVNSSGHGFAVAAGTTASLESAASGLIRILHKGTGSSTRRCAVYLGDQTSNDMATRNVDGTESGTSTNVWYDQATGIQIVQGPSNDTVSLRAATPTQMGAVSTVAQNLGGAKAFRNALYRTQGSLPSSITYPAVWVDLYATPYVSFVSMFGELEGDDIGYAVIGATKATGGGAANYVGGNVHLSGGNTSNGGATVFSSARYDAPNTPGIYAYTAWGCSADGVAYAGYIAVGSLASGGVRGLAFYSPGQLPSQFDIYAVASEWSGTTPTGPVRHRQNSYVADGKAWGATRSGVDYPGVDVVDAGVTYRGGLRTGGTTSIPPSPPPPPPAAGSISTAMLADNSVTDAKLRDSAALSVIGRSANTTGDPADLAAATDGDVLRRSGTALGFGQVATAGIADAAVTNAKLANVATSTLKGRTTAGTGVPEDLTSTQATALLNVVTSTLKGLAPALGTDGQVAQNNGGTITAQFPKLWTATASATSNPYNLTLVANNTLSDIPGASVSLPSAGTYLISFSLLGVVQDSVAGGSIDLVLNVAGVDGYSIRGGYASTANVAYQMQSEGTFVVTATGAATAKLRGTRNTVGVATYAHVYNATITAMRVGP